MTDSDEDEGYTLEEHVGRIDLMLQMILSALLMSGPDPRSRSKVFEHDETANLVDDGFDRARFFAETWRASYDAGGEI
jgi:hypothetical protein